MINYILDRSKSAKSLNFSKLLHAVLPALGSNNKLVKEEAGKFFSKCVKLLKYRLFVENLCLALEEKGLSAQVKDQGAQMLKSHVKTILTSNSSNLEYAVFLQHLQKLYACADKRLKEKILDVILAISQYVDPGLLYKSLREELDETSILTL